MPKMVDIQEELYDTRLHEAVRYCDFDEIKAALKEGYDPNQIGLYQWSPLHEACSNGDEDIVKLLLKYQGDANSKDALQGCTAVHYAASQGHVSCLKLLLQAGGLYSISNDEGQNALDVAVDECYSLLEEERDKTIPIELAKKDEVLNTLNASETSLSSVSLSSVHTESDHYSHSPQGSQKRDSGLEQDSVSEFDEISVTSTSSGSSQLHAKAWSLNCVTSPNKALVLGHIQLSFEYNKKKSSLKVRVWQVLDLLMPLGETSMIHSIYVKAYLLPDPKKESKRKTEELKLDTRGYIDSLKQVKSEIFKPSSFKFSKPLEYSDITSAMICEKCIALSVCITQKYTRRSYIIASLSLPLKKATHNLLKEKYPLHLNSNISIPENMKVYHAGELDIVRSRNFISNPNLVQRNPSFSSWAVPYHERSSSESDLKHITIENVNQKVPSIEITVPEEVDEQLQEALEQIAIMEAGERSSETLKKKPSSVKLDIEFTSQNVLDQNADFQGVSIDSSLNVTQVEVHVPSEDICTRIQSQSSDSSLPSVRSDISASSSKKQHKSLTKHYSLESEGSTSDYSSPDIPSWDYHSEPLISVTHGDSYTSSEFEAPQLPMAIEFDLPQVHGSFQCATFKGEGRKSAAEHIPLKTRSNAHKMSESSVIDMSTVNSQGNRLPSATKGASASSPVSHIATSTKYDENFDEEWELAM